MKISLPRSRRHATVAVATLLLVGVVAVGTWQEARRAAQGEALLRAAGCGDTRAVQTLLAAGANPNWRPSALTVMRRATPPTVWNNPRHWPALARAWRAGAFDVSPGAALTDRRASTEAFLLLGQNRRVWDGYGTWDQYVRNPLILAASRGDVPTMRALLRAGANVEARDGDGRTALLVAVGGLQYPSEPKAGYETAIRLLLDHGANVHAVAHTASNWVFGIGETPLHVAANGGWHWKRRGQGVHAQVLRALLDRGADPNAAAADGATPLMRAVDCKNLPAAQTLLRAGARVSARDADGRTALSLAAAAKRPDLIALLKQAGARR